METLDDKCSLNESVGRFSVFHDHHLEGGDVWYRMRAEENHLRFGTSGEARPKARRKSLERRYYQCFYNSFLDREDRFYSTLLQNVLQREFVERAGLSTYEAEEFCGICRYAGEVLNVPSWSRCGLASLSVTEAEEVERRVLEGDFFDMLLEAVATLENLHRRTIMFVNEPASRSAIEGRVVNDWVDSRRRQVGRERMERLEEEKKERQSSLAYHIWKERQARQLFLFEESEQDERMDLERLQRLHLGVIADLRHREHKEARYCELKYQMMRRLLPAGLSRDIMADETIQRSAIMLLQRDRFYTLQGEEVKSFLWTRRNILMNEAVSRERRGDVSDE